MIDLAASLILSAPAKPVNGAIGRLILCLSSNWPFGVS